MDMMAKPTCTCVSDVDALLAERNTVISTDLFSGRPMVDSVKLDSTKRGRPVSVFASFCPFCGIRYPDRADATLATRTPEPSA